MVRRVNPMLRTFAPLTCALLGLALGGCSQQNGVFSPETAQSSASSGAAQSPPAPPLPSAARRATTLIGLPVRSKSGKTLGAVQDLVFGDDGSATHLIVVRGRAAGPPGTLTAIPWATAMRHIHAGALVMSAKRLAGAPGFPPARWPDLDKKNWSAAYDGYWSRTSPNAFKPIDSTNRSRPRFRF